MRSADRVRKRPMFGCRLTIRMTRMTPTRTLRNSLDRVGESRRAAGRASTGLGVTDLVHLDGSLAHPAREGDEHLFNRHHLANQLHALELPPTYPPRSTKS